MTSTLRCDDVAVGDLLSGHNLYEIPAFQRDYSWTENEAQRLYDDINTACETSRQSVETLPYFLGTMLFVGADEPQSSIRSALVVDGQQRLITLTVLVSALRDFLADDQAAILHSRVAIMSQTEPFEFVMPHVRPREVDARFLQHAIQRRGATRLPRGKADLKPANEPQRRIESVRALFVKRIKDAEPQRRSEIARFLLEQCRVLRIWAPDIDYAYRLFLSINKPGLPLSDEDIVLAEVVGPLAVEQRHRYETVIAQMSRYREPQAKGRRQDKTFFTHLAVAQRWARSDRMISLLRRVVAREGGPGRFAETIFEPMAQAYLMTRGDWLRSGLPEAAWQYLDGLRVLERFCCSEWVAPAMLILARLQNDHERLVACLRGLDRFAFLLALTKSTADDRRTAYRPVIDRIWDSEEFPDPESLFPLDDQRQAAFIRRAALKLKDAANGANKAVLIRLDSHLSKRPLADYIHLIENKFTGDDRLTLEHIVPNGDTLGRSSTWREEFSNVRYRKIIANNLANLVLLEEKRNKTAGQLDFDAKKAIFFPEDSTHDLLITDQVRTAPHWNREHLLERYQAMTQAVKENWSLKGPIPELPAPPDETVTDAGPGEQIAAADSTTGKTFRHVIRSPRKRRRKKSES